MGKYGRCHVDGNRYEIHYGSKTIALYDGDLDVVALMVGNGWVKMSRDDLRMVNQQVCQCRSSMFRRERRANNG